MIPLSRRRPAHPGREVPKIVFRPKHAEDTQQDCLDGCSSWV
jgi:hypothetical protein